MRPWENFSLMIALGAIVGALTGGFPAYAQEASTAALVLAMTLSLTEVQFRGISGRSEARFFARAFFLSYGVLSGLILVIAALFADETLRAGWIVMAAVPSAVAVIPLTSLFRGNVQRALVSTAFLYLAALAVFPVMTLALVGRAADLTNLAVQILLQIALPLAASRPLARIPALADRRLVLVNVSFFVLVLAITGANRTVFFEDLALIAALCGASLVRTWGIGWAVLSASRRWAGDRDTQVSDALFGSFKNLALAALLAFSLFGATAALPAIVCLFFEIAWVAVLARRFQD